MDAKSLASGPILPGAPRARLRIQVRPFGQKAAKAYSTHEMMSFPRVSKRLRHAVLGLSLTGVTLGGFSACEDDEEEGQHEALGKGTNTAPRDGEFTIMIPVVAQVGDQALACGMEYPGFGLAQSIVEFSEFALYVHDVHLRNEDGAWVRMRMRDDGMWQRDGVALLDFLGHGSPACAQQGTAETNTLITGYMPEGKYSAIRFSLGVPASHNHINAVTEVAPFNRQRMWWSWASGFRYLKADMRVRTVRPDGTIKDTPKYYAHLGGVNCSKDPTTLVYGCKDPRVAVVEFPLDPSREGIVVNPLALFAQDDLSIGRGCMGGFSLKDPADPKELVPNSCRPQYLATGLNTDGEVAVPVNAQSLFVPKPWSGTAPAMPALPTLAQVSSPEGIRNPLYWPRMDYQRPPALDQIQPISTPFGRISHAPQDPRYGQSCLNCHQAKGPGPGRFEFAGTIYKEDGSPYAEGEVEIVMSQGKGVWGAQDPNKKVPNAKVHMRVPIDAQGQFFATKSAIDSFAAQNGVPPVEYVNQNYQAFILNRDGERIMAMSPKKAGSCNQCHTGGFRLVVPARLMSGPWTPATPGAGKVDH